MSEAEGMRAGCGALPATEIASRLELQRRKVTRMLRPRASVEGAGVDEGLPRPLSKPYLVGLLLEIFGAIHFEQCTDT